MKWPAYPKYKASGVEWLGDVPLEWKAKRVSHLFDFTSGGTPDTDVSEYWNGSIPWVSSKDMKAFRLCDTEDHISEMAVLKSATSLIPKGSVLMVTRSGILRHTIPVALIQRTMAINQDIKGLVPKKEIYPDYFSYIVVGLQTQLLSLWRQQGATVESLNFDKVKCTVFFFPPLEDQVSIVQFLDLVTAKLDALLDKKRSLIERLKEKRSALISLTVTKGLPPEVAEEYAAKNPGLDAKALAKRKLKPSGVDWLGDVPEEWTLPALNIRYSVDLGKMLDEKKISGKYLVPYLRNVDVQWGRINYENLPEMDILESEYARCTIKQGDLLVCEGGEVGRAAIVGGTNGIIGYQKALHRLRARSSDESPRYMFYVLQWAASTGIFSAEETATIAHLTGEKLRRFRFPKPPILEQSAIAEFLDHETSKVERMIEKVEAAIAKLSEYRTALITAAVTGRIDVRGFKP